MNWSGSLIIVVGLELTINLVTGGRVNWVNVTKGGVNEYNPPSRQKVRLAAVFGVSAGFGGTELDKGE